MTPSAKEILENLGGQMFAEDFFMYNITEHQFVPKFNLLSTDEKQKILTAYSATESQFPAMLVGDPISKYYNYRPGDLIEITRTDGEVSYRVIV